MDHHKCSFELVNKNQNYFDYIDRELTGLSEEKLLQNSVPDYIRANILVHLTHSMVLNCKFFCDCESGFLRQIMISMTQQYFTSKDMILTSSSPTRGMYFVKKGVVELLNNDHINEMETIKQLEAGDSFAEGCLVEYWEKNPFLARSVTNCELWYLGCSTFNRLVDSFPHVRIQLRKRERKKRKSRRFSLHSNSKAIALAKKVNYFFIHPDNIFVQIWFGLILLVIIYSIVAIPFRLSFMENYEVSKIWLVMDYFADILLLCHIIIRSCFLAYYNANHLVITRSEILSHYKNSSKMKWHALSIIPFDIAMATKTSFCPLWTLQFWSLLRMNKILWISEIRYLIDCVESSLIKAGVRVPKNPLRVGKLVIVIILSAHWVACIFFMMANFNQHSHATDGEMQNNWANKEGLLDASPSCPGLPVDFSKMMEQYIAALYWSMATLTTVGYGDITAHENSAVEIIFATVILVIGTAIYTMVIALLEDIVSQLDVTSSLHNIKMNKLKLYFQSQSVPDALKTKIITYYDVLWRTQKGVSGKKILTFLGHSIRSDVTLNMLTPLLGKTFYLKDCSTEFVLHLLDKISLEIYLPGDTIYHEGEKCDSLFFVYKGEVDLFTSKNVKFKKISDCVLGEASFFGLEPHICTAKSFEICEIFLLNLEVS